MRQAKVGVCIGCFVGLLVASYGFAQMGMPPNPSDSRKSTLVASGPSLVDSEKTKPVTPSRANKPYVQVGPTKRYFRFEDGRPFYVIGHNEWPARFYLDKNSPESMEWYFQNMRAHGENVLRLVLPTHGLLAEKPPGTFNPAFKQYLDNLVRLAEKHDIYLQVTFWPNVFKTRMPSGFYISWKDHPYNKKNGGPVAEFEDLFVDPKAWAFQEGRIRFFVDNWGASSHIFAWEIANEFNDTNSAWINHMAKYCKDYERSKFGKAHMTCISVSSSSVGESSDAQWSSPYLDFSTFHTYGKEDLRPSSKVLRQNLRIPGIMTRAIQKTGDRPVFDSETPEILRGDRKWTLGVFASRRILEESFLAFGFAYICSGAASPGLRWPTSGGHRIQGTSNGLSEAMYGYQLAMRRFVSQVDWNKIDPLPYKAAELKSPDTKEPLHLIATVSKDSRHVIGWIVHSLGASKPIRVTGDFSNLSAEGHRLRWFEDSTGKELKEEKVQGERVSATSPSFVGHIAFLIQPSASTVAPASAGTRQ